MAVPRCTLAAACAAALFAATPSQVEAILVGQVGQRGLTEQEDREHKAQLLAKMAVMDVKCEDMCKKIGVYPKCQCPGFEGNPATDDDTRKCMDQWCQDPSTPCPSDGFVTCVKEATAVSALQWDSLLQRFDHSVTLYSGMVRAVEEQKTNHAAGSCAEEDHNRLAVLQAKMAVFDVKCEDMCKKIGVYPKCQCPGFEGNPPSDGDTRKCMDQWCKDPSTPCPTDGFVTCVKEATKVSALQWGSMFERLSSSLDLYKNALTAARITSKSHA